MIPNVRLKFSDSRGAVLLITLAILLTLSVIALVSVKTSETEMSIAGNDVKRTQALLAAEAGIANTENIFRTYPKQINADTLMAWINAASSLPNTSFRVAMESGLPVRNVIALGKSQTAEAAVQVTYRYAANPYNIWNNAIFAGHGQDGVSIRGNTGVHGSVHILGNGEPYIDANGNGKWDAGEPYTDANRDGGYDRPMLPTEPALSLTGTANISNNYNGLSATLASRLPPITTSTYAGETVQSLMAELRVQHGQVVLDGSANVGEPNVAGGSPAIKETMDATWVSDGYTGSAATGSVFSDNGFEEAYDMEDRGVKMPNLDEPYTDPMGASYTTYMAYLKSKAVVVNGNLKIECGVMRSGISAGTNSLSIDALGNITANGTIYVTGNIEIVGACPVKYDGRFTLVSEGDVLVDADFYSKGTFPTDDVAGVISHGKLLLGDKSSQLKLAGAIFAQQEVITNKQTQLAGTIVSNYFNMTQVPNIFQVPGLAGNLPPYMPGGDDVYAYAWLRVPKSWTELY